MDFNAVRRLVDDITVPAEHQGATLDDAAVKRLKKVVRDDDEVLGQAYTLLSERLGDKHAHVRYLALLLAGFLFRRSALFRKLLCLDFERFVQCTMGLDIDHPLPAPSNFAALLREKALELVEVHTEPMQNRREHAPICFFCGRRGTSITGPPSRSSAWVIDT